MKPWIAIAAVATLSAGCAGGRAPAMAGEGGSGETTDKAIYEAYTHYLYRLACPDVDNCDNVLWRQQPRVAQVSQSECAPARPSGRIRCEFLASEQVYLGEHLHMCAGWFRRNGDALTMLSVIGECWPPAARRNAEGAS
jgi:hypothetical protein